MIKSVNIYIVLLVMVIVPLSSKPISSSESKVYESIMGKIGKSEPYNLDKAVLNSAYGDRLELLPNGTVQGTRNVHSKYTKLEVHSIGSGIMRIYGIYSKKYLAIDDRGYLLAQEQPTLNTVFKEIFSERLYQLLMSYKRLVSKKSKQDQEWFVALKRNGKAKRATHTSKRQKSVKFIFIFEENSSLGNN